MSLTNGQRNSVEQPTERKPQQQGGQQQAHDNGRDEVPQAHNERTQVNVEVRVMPLYWLGYRHNNGIAVVIEPGASHLSK